MKKDISNINGLDYDFTIIGTGFAGITLAIALSKKGKKVLLLEAGGYEFSDKSHKVYEGKIIGSYPKNYLTSRRARFFGGTSNIWGGWCRPLDEIDFEKWPINKTDLDPYLLEACQMLKIKSEFNKDKKIDNDFSQIQFQFSLPPVKFAKEYKKFIEQSNLIDVALNSYVLSIRENLESNIPGAAGHLEVSNENFKIHKIKINKVIVACGGIENNRLLLWSQNQNQKLFSNLKIGKKFMEHPHYKTGDIIANYPEIYDVLDTGPDLSTKKIIVGPTAAMMKRENIGNAGIRLKIKKVSEIKKFTRMKQAIKEIVCISPSFGKKLLQLANKRQACWVQVQMAWEQKPSDENSVELDFDNKDDYGVPRVKVKMKFNQKDRETAKIIMEKLGESFIKKDIGRIGMLKYLDSENTKFPEELLFFKGGHHMGGTQMSNSEFNGVVDTNLKVFNTDNVWVAGSSTFTTGGHANPTLSIVQLSLRLADHLS
jgi:choline dehydrogenase-like flavoprotein